MWSTRGRYIAKYESLIVLSDGRTENQGDVSFFVFALKKITFMINKLSSTRDSACVLCACETMALTARLPILDPVCLARRRLGSASVTCFPKVHSCAKRSSRCVCCAKPQTRHHRKRLRRELPSLLLWDWPEEEIVINWLLPIEIKQFIPPD